MTKFTWKIGGEAGFGIMTTGLSFSKIAIRQGYNIFDLAEYPSLIRGGHNAYEVIVGNEEVHALKKDIDFLVCLNEETYKVHEYRLNPNGVIVYDDEEFKIAENFVKISVPFKKTLQDLKGLPIMKNTIAMGASLAILGADLEIFKQIIKEEFGRKGEEIVNFNIQFARAGFDHVKNNYSQHIKSLLSKRAGEETIVLTGNDAFSLGAVVGDCRLYASYPMTPSTGVLTDLAVWQQKTGMVVRHPEDEIAAIMTAIGAGFAGARAACGTSGGGFALKVESISLAGMTETPVVIFISQRPGPATGLPTWTEQGDLLFTVHAGHGEFPKIVLAPGDVQEMIELTAKAFNLADIYQLPVIVMSDMYLSESHKSLSKQKLNDFIANYKVNRGKTINQPSETKYLRYKITDDGISERLIPGAKNYFYQANSYEHLEDGHTTENSEERKKQVEKRDRKWKTYLQNDFLIPKVYGELDTANTILVSWGSIKGVLLEVQKMLKNIAIVHFNHVYPLDKEKLMPLFNKSGKRYILVENNHYGQFGKLLLAETGIEIKDKILKYDGRQFGVEEIVDKILNLN